MPINIIDAPVREKKEYPAQLQEHTELLQKHGVLFIRGSHPALKQHLQTRRFPPTALLPLAASQLTQTDGVWDATTTALPAALSKAREDCECDCDECADLAVVYWLDDARPLLRPDDSAACIDLLVTPFLDPAGKHTRKLVICAPDGDVHAVRWHRAGAAPEYAVILLPQQKIVCGPPEDAARTDGYTTAPEDPAHPQDAAAATPRTDTPVEPAPPTSPTLACAAVDPEETDSTCSYTPPPSPPPPAEPATPPEPKTPPSTSSHAPPPSPPPPAEPVTPTVPTLAPLSTESTVSRTPPLSPPISGAGQEHEEPLSAGGYAADVSGGE